MTVMKKLFIFTAGVLLNVSFAVHAQDDIVVKAGTRIIDYFSHDEIYRYPEFISGKVIFKNGTFTAARLNYSKLAGTMQFIRAGDTLDIGNAKDIDHVDVGQDTFYYNNGYLEKIAGNDQLMLLEKNYIKITDVQKQSGYGTTSSVAATTSYSSLPSGGRYYNLQVKEDLVLRKLTEFYLSTEPGKYLPVRKKTVLRLLPDHQSAVKNYLRGNDIRLNNREDLIKLVSALMNLVSK
jgi:hypothetical protein